MSLPSHLAFLVSLSLAPFSLAAAIAPSSLSDALTAFITTYERAKRKEAEYFA